jgi:hypothetical protein
MNRKYRKEIKRYLISMGILMVILGVVKMIINII